MKINGYWITILCVNMSPSFPFLIYFLFLDYFKIFTVITFLYAIVIPCFFYLKIGLQIYFIYQRKYKHIRIQEHFLVAYQNHIVQKLCPWKSFAFSNIKNLVTTIRSNRKNVYPCDIQDGCT